MKFARITLVQPPGTRHPMQGFRKEADGIVRERMLAWTVPPEIDEWSVLFHVVGDREAYGEAVSDVDHVREWDLTAAGGGAFYAYVVHGASQAAVEFVAPFAVRNLVVVPPMEYGADGETTLIVVGDPDDLQGLIEALPDPVVVDVERIGEYDHRYGTLAGRLTERQREAVRAAMTVGYYGVPREATLEEVAAELDCTPGSASTVLRRAEAAVMEAVLEG